MAMCARGSERRLKRLWEEEAWLITAVDFEAYGRPLEMVTAFKYLGRIITASDDNWPAVVEKFQKARKQWSRLSRIIGWEGVDPWTSGNFYKSVVQETLLFGT